jgi:transcription elongation factor Elf1
MMRIRKIILLYLTLALSFTCISCANKDQQQTLIKPQVSQMKAICELATMECYYHNVAKYTEKDAEGMWFWKKDKRFWIEYSGVVKIGIDASLVNIEVEEASVTITIPEAKVLDSDADDVSLTKDSYIVDIDSADIKGEDQTKAFAEAQNNMVEAASKDTALLASAQQRAQTLLEEYVSNIGNVVGKEYSIEWKYIKDDSANTDEEELFEK